MEVLDLTTNVSQIFTEMYKKYSMLSNNQINVFENSLYVNGIQSSTIRERMNDALLKYHKKEGTFGLYVDPSKPMEDQVFLPGNGSTQLYKGLVYAIVTSHPNDEFLFVQKIPYFSGHRDAVNKVFSYPNAKYQGYRDPSEIIHKEGLTIIEFVTSPNNPDGEFRKPETNPDIILGDFVFTSSSFGTDGTGYLDKNLEWIKEYREKGIPIFSYNSASKQFGHTGDRLGYMWFPMYNDFAKSIFSQLNNFLAITVGSNLQGSSNFLDLLPPLTKNGIELRKDTNESLKLRFDNVSKSLLVKYPGSLISTVPGSPTLFVKISDPRIDEGKTASEIIFEDTSTQVADGSSFGEDDTYVRINIMAFGQDLAVFSNRLINEEKYTKRDMTVFTRKIREKILICGSEDKKTVKYVANPNDRRIDVDASDGNVRIVLPQFLGYEPSYKLKIKRIDNTNHKVGVCMDSFCLSMKQCGFVCLVWKQPFYHNGSWKVIEMKRSKRKSDKKPKSAKVEINKHMKDMYSLYLV